MDWESRKYFWLGALAVVTVLLAYMALQANRIAVEAVARQRTQPPPMDTNSVYAAAADAGRELLGTTPPEWTASFWFNSPPLTLESLRGKVVLVRWWTAPDCPYCRASAPALNEFWENYRVRGLVMVGMYHHKTDTPLSRQHVQQAMEEFGFKFPVAVDQDWTTLRRWWLAGDEKRWTSVTFLLDREGVIRHIHPGGSYFKGEPGYDALRARLEDLLK